MSCAFVMYTYIHAHVHVYVYVYMYDAMIHAVILLQYLHVRIEL